MKWTKSLEVVVIVKLYVCEIKWNIIKGEVYEEIYKANYKNYFYSVELYCFSIFFFEYGTSYRKAEI